MVVKITTPTVPFDVNNPEHLKALQYFHKYGRQHPTLRFSLSGVKHSSVYHHMVHCFLERYMPEDVKIAVDADIKAALPSHTTAFALNPSV